jgi:hypothetical protein
MEAKDFPWQEPTGLVCHDSTLLMWLKSTQNKVKKATESGWSLGGATLTVVLRALRISQLL